MQRDFQLGASIIKVLPKNTEYYRCQGKSPDPDKPWDVYNFQVSPFKKRFAPENGACTYFALDVATAFLETTPEFREIKPGVPRPRLPFGLSELNEKEIVHFKLNKELRLLDLVEIGLLQRHSLTLEEIRGADYSVPTEMATAVYSSEETQVDGILYATQMGSTHSIVVFDTSRSLMETTRELSDRKPLGDSLFRDKEEIEQLFFIQLNETL